MHCEFEKIYFNSTTFEIIWNYASSNFNSMSHHQTFDIDRRFSNLGELYKSYNKLSNQTSIASNKSMNMKPQIMKYMN